jgi:cupin 2 domain-containing protein
MVKPKRPPAFRRGKFPAHDARSGKGETAEILAGLLDGARVERIVSRGEASPPDFWYDQKEDEWVMLAVGTATIVFEDRRVRLRSGDWLFIPAHCRHRVASTSKDAVWLAVFMEPTGHQA